MLFEDLTLDISLETLSRYASKMSALERQGKKDAIVLYNNDDKPSLPATMSLETRNEYKEAFTNVGLARLIVQKFANAMYGRDVERTYGNEQIDEYMKEELTQIRLRAPVLCRACSTVGDAVVRIRPGWFGLKYSVFTGDSVVPILDPFAPDIEPIGMVYDYVTQMMDAQIKQATRNGNAESVHVQEIITRHQRDDEGNIALPGIRVRFINDKRVPYYDGDTGLNPYGDFLDCSYWRNTQEFDTGRGESDILPLRRLLEKVNHIITDGNLLLKWRLNPIITTTAEYDKSNPLKYNWRQIWHLGENSDGSPAQVNMLSWDTNQIGGFLEFVQYLVSLITMTSRIPSASIGDTENLSQLSSGRAYEIAMTPLIDLVNERTPLYTVNEMDLLTTSLAVRGVVDNDRKILGNGVDGYLMPDYQKIRALMADASVEFGSMSLAKSPLEDAQVHSIRISAGYESEQTAIEDTHPEWSDIQVADELERIGMGAPETIDKTAQARVAAMGEALNGDNTEQ